MDGDAIYRDTNAVSKFILVAEICNQQIVASALIGGEGNAHTHTQWNHSLID